MPFRCYANVREVPRVAALSDEDFYWKYLWTNMPVIVGDAFLQAARTWGRERERDEGTRGP